MTVRLYAGGCDLTERARGLEWSTVDPGGMELANFDLPNNIECPTPGAPVVISAGLERVFMGRVEEPGDNYDAQTAYGQVAAVGAGAAGKDNQISAVFIDRSLSRWRGASSARKLANATAGRQTLDPEVVVDETTGAPALRNVFRGAWTTSGLPFAEALYDAGAGNLLGRIRASWARNANAGSSAPWEWQGALMTGDNVTGVDVTGNLVAAGPGTINLASAGSRRYAYLFIDVGSGAGGADGVEYALVWTNVRVFGDHGLTIRGATAAEEGFYPSDIAAYVLGLVPGLERGIVVDSSDLILPHSTYYTPVDHERIALDMATLMGWHYGVWEPLSLLSDTPRWDFRPRPTEATVIVKRTECQGLRLAQRLSDFHDRATTTYQDAAGSSGVTTVTRANPRLPAGLSRTLQLNAGATSAAIAASQANIELALEEQQSRAAGSVTLPPYVRTASGALKPSYLIKAGLDRLKITGLPNAGPWTETDTRRFDTFRVRRLSHKVQPGGQIVTTAELDSGSNLIETMQARLAVAAALAG